MFNEGPTILVVGAGIRFPDHFTGETLEVLRSCDQIFTVLLPDELAKLPNDLRLRTTSVRDRYLPNRERVSNYQGVAGVLIDATVHSQRVAWLTKGHPRVLDSVTHLLITSASSCGYEVSVYPSISSIDSILVDMSYDPADGLLILECTTCVRRQTVIPAGVAVLMLQPGTFGSEFPEGGEHSDLSELMMYLLRFFQPEHQLAFVVSAGSRKVQSTIRWIQISDLHLTPLNEVTGSIFIPPTSGVC